MNTAPIPSPTAGAREKPTLHFLCGKMAAGKSTLSKKLAGEFNAILICEDLWLARLFGEEIRTFDDYLTYATRLKEIVMPHVVDLLKHGNSVVLDFPGNVARQRQWFRTIFETAGANHVLHFVDLPDALCKAQLHKRNTENPPGSKPMSDEEFDHVTSYFVAPTDAEQFNIKFYDAALRA